jgi:hypothetical protein
MTDGFDIEEQIQELNPKAVLFRSPDMSQALIGWGQQNTGGETKYYAVYDYNLMVESLQNDEDMSQEEAIDWLSYNTMDIGGDNFPIILHKMP